MLQDNEIYNNWIKVFFRFIPCFLYSELFETRIFHNTSAVASFSFASQTWIIFLQSCSFLSKKFGTKHENVPLTHFCFQGVCTFINLWISMCILTELQNILSKRKQKISQSLTQKKIGEIQFWIVCYLI